MIYNDEAYFIVPFPSWDQEQGFWVTDDISCYREVNIEVDGDEEGDFRIITDMGDVFVNQDVPEWGLKAGDNLNKLPAIDKLAKSLEDDLKINK